MLLVGVFIFGASGCQGEETTWTAEAQSPDGRWLASARTIEEGGFGTAAAQTNVYLKWIKDSKAPEAILVLAHDPTSTSKTINLSMKWVTPSHLEVTYNGRARVELQMVKYGDVDISLRDLSTEPKNAPQ